jgi:hypothetical protein
MTPAPADRRLDPTVLLGVEGPDVGCDVCFELLDQYVEALEAGADTTVAFPGMAEHLHGCPACDEEATSLVAVVASPPPVRPPAA